MLRPASVEAPGGGLEIRAARLHAEALRVSGPLGGTARERDRALTEVHRQLLERLRTGRPVGVWHARAVRSARADPPGWLRRSGRLRVGAEDVEVWVADFLDVFWDDPIPRRVLELHPRRRRALHRRAGQAARALLLDLRGRSFDTLADKEQALREHLLALRARLLAEASR